MTSLRLTDTVVLSRMLGGGWSQPVYELADWFNSIRQTAIRNRNVKTGHIWDESLSGRDREVADTDIESTDIDPEFVAILLFMGSYFAEDVFQLDNIVLCVLRCQVPFGQDVGLGVNDRSTAGDISLEDFRGD